MKEKTIYLVLDNDCEVVFATETKGDAEIMIAEQVDDDLYPEQWEIEETTLFYWK
jgi:hypothetical protein